MKRSFYIFSFLLFSISSAIYAQVATEGVYLSAEDFNNGKISYGHSQPDKKYRFCAHLFFNTSTIKIVSGTSVTRLKKDSVFGFRDNKNSVYRIINKEAYRIFNPGEKILIYSHTSFENELRHGHYVTNYFFSAGAGSPMYTLSKENLKTVLSGDISFHQLLDIYFNSDDDLQAYDSLNQMYRLNRVYQLSRQTYCKIITN